MSAGKRRVETLKVLVTGSVIASSSSYHQIISEFDDVVSAGEIRLRSRKSLLQLLHSTRALDTALSEFLVIHSIGYRSPSLGGYLYALMIHTEPGLNQLSGSERSRFQSQIVDKRNMYMHKAGTFPNGSEVAYLLSEMDACLSRVLSL